MKSFFIFLLVCLVVERSTAASGLPEALTGRYVEQRGFYTSVTLGTNGTYTNFLYGCSRASATRVGAVTLTNQLIILHASDSRSSDETLYPIAWGGRRYLINTNDILEFCRAVNDKSEPRDSYHGYFLLRENDWKVPVAGYPEVPPPWDKHLGQMQVLPKIEEPAVIPRKRDGKVTEVIDGQRAWINLGKEHGLDDGMELQASGSAREVYLVEQSYARQSTIRVKGKGRGPRIGLTFRSLTGP